MDDKEFSKDQQIKELQESEHQFQDLYDKAPDMFASVDAKTSKIIRCNETTAKALGYSKKEIVGRPIFDLYPDETLEHIKDTVIQKFRETGEIRNAELKLKRKDGSTIDVMLNASSVLDDHGNILYSRSIWRDISENKKIEHELRQYRRNLEKLVEERTSELSQKKAQLENEIEERKRAEAIIIREKEEWERTFDTITDLITIIDADKKILKANRAVSKKLGIKREDLIGKPCYEVFHGVDAPPSYCPHTKTQNDGLAHQDEIFEPYLNRHFIFSSDPLFDSNGNFQGVVEVAHDITDRKKAEEALERSEKRFRDIAEYALEWIWEVDIRGKYTYVSPIVEKILGYKPQEVLGKYFYDFFHPDDRDELKQAALEAFEEKKPFRNFLNRNVHKDGNIVWLLTTGLPITDDKGTLTGYRGTDTDITESKQAQEALKESERFAYSTIDSLSAHIAVLDTNGKIIAVNQAWCHFADANPPVPPHYGVGLNYLSLSETAPGESGEEGPDFAQAIREVIRGERESFSMEYPCHSSEEQRWFIGRITPFLTGGVVVAHENITDRKKTEAQINRALLELERSNQELERFAYIASHDLKEPLRTISGFASLLQARYKDKLDGTADEFIDFIMSGTSRMGQLIDDLLAYSRITAGTEKFESVDLNKILVRSISNLTVVIESTKAKITHDPLPTLIARDIQMEQLFQNLISNGIKFHGESPPHVHISSQKSKRKWVISFQDNGIGISDEDRPKIFEMFYRLHGRSDYSGTGIGLAICRKIVEMHEGEIWVESRPGKGSVFYFSIPDKMKGQIEKAQEIKNITR